MFDGLLKSKFYSRCKSAIKITKTRVEMIKRKRSAMQKYLKNDISDLLKNRLDINAYGRAEGLLVELNMSACYEFIEQFCGCISNQLSLMNKQRECPEECKEAISSLIFAAARFADLPELRELRSIFADKYGNSIEAYVNGKFVEKLKAMPPSTDAKLQLLQDIALEFGIQWDSKVLEQKLYNPPASEHARSKNVNNDKYKAHKTRDKPIRKINQQEEEIPSYGRKEVGDDLYKLPDNDDPPGKDIPVASTDKNEQQKKSNKVSEEKAGDKRSFYYRFIPPPYTKPKAAETEAKTNVSVENNRNQNDSAGEAKPQPRSVRRRPLKPPPGHDEGNGIKHEASKQRLKIVNKDDRKGDEEERKMDQLLMHYSAKKSPQQSNVDAGNRPTRNQSKARAMSLPEVLTMPPETNKGLVRASSCQPDSGHVHPKLPDYDDFLARLAALRGQ
ncbi:IST1-like protein [Actinidia chinensis var. chinensis]|uniref:IST1-like protein n=1 Tax=Actinidia chinensis var. chinensis TaxID=1590841 RepID=A0A2R6QZU6_ACTCC|nr:IST1-like protein [Actinidia chinensis var. chinensis]